MSTKTKKADNPIALELNKYENKVREFQAYLEKTIITSIADDASRHKEIDIQLKMMEKLPFYLSEIKKLRVIIQEGIDKINHKIESTMGDQELSPLEQRIF